MIRYLIYVVLLSTVVSISSPGPLTKEVGQDVVFMFNASNIVGVTWGIRDGNTNNLKQGLMNGNIQDGMELDKKINSTSYAERVSFVGDLSKGQAWFKITNLNINDTNEYMARMTIQRASGYIYVPVQLIVTPPATTTTAGPSTISVTSAGIVTTTQDPTTLSPTNPPILKNLTTSLKVNRRFTQDLADNNSPAFTYFSISFRAEIIKAYTSRKEENFENVTVIQLREGSILVTFIVFFKNETSREKACSPIEEAINNGKLGSFEIVPGSLGCSKERASSPRPPDARTGVHPGIIAGVAIVGVLAIAGLVITIIYVCRKKSSKKAYRSSSGPGYDMQTKHGEPEEQYASVQRPGATGATQPHDQPLPQYAAVDKSRKKKKPKDRNELIYAQLDHDYNASMGTRPPSDRRPTSGSDTVYADIQSDKQKQRHPPPQYGNMQDISHA